MKIPFRNVESRALRIWLRISLIPYIVLFLAAVYGAFFGVGWFFSTSDGAEGAILAIIVAAAYMTIVPVLPAAIIFQIFAFAGIKMKRTGAGKKTKIKVNLTIIGIFAAIALLILGSIFSNAIKEKLDAPKAKRFVADAECVIEFDKSTPHTVGPFGIEEHLHNIIAVDYDKMKVGFIQHNYYDTANYFKLEKITETDPRFLSACENHPVKTDIRTMTAPAKRMVILSEKGNINCVGAIFIFMEDGTLWFSDVSQSGRPVAVVINDLDMRVADNTYFTNN